MDVDIPSAFASGETRSILAQLTLHGSYDTRDQFLNPKRGVVISGETGLLSPGGATTNFSWIGEGLASAYVRLRSGLVAAFTVAGGFLNVSSTDPDEVNTLRTTSSFWRTAHVSPVRGFMRDDITRGKPAFAYSLTRFELRQRIWSIWGVVAFADAGTGWTLEDAGIGWRGLSPGRRVYSVGFGPRIDWLLPVRVDIVRQLANPVETDDTGSIVGLGSRGWKIEFGIGQAF